MRICPMRIESGFRTDYPASDFCLPFALFLDPIARWKRWNSNWRHTLQDAALQRLNGILTRFIWSRFSGMNPSLI
ncbi:MULTISPECIES: hypothetical protein [unclassified Xanthomonas]|uniref:hypothetical protein n=1 Tax=Xanthomonas sp. LMG 8992 TaxID=1591157 RepID=UPI00136D3658|nr:hypothetical protein [Xanthomonas sp. LMG 8992]